MDRRAWNTLSYLPLRVIKKEAEEIVKYGMTKAMWDGGCEEILLADEEAHQIRAVESASGAYSSRDVETAGGTTDSDVADEDTTEVVHTT